MHLNPSSHAAHLLIEAPARLHFGMLDLRGSLGRTFGGIGAGIPNPAVRLEASRASTLSVSGAPGISDDDLARAREFATRALSALNCPGSVRLHLQAAIPAHAGLGSGTQLALATARVIAELYERPTDATTLTRAVGRAQRSAIGTWLFERGGFVLEGGRRRGDDRPAPLLARLPIPSGWRCVVAIPRAVPGASGDAEVTAFANLPAPPESDAEHVAHLVLMALLPALIDADLQTFGRALTEIQCINGRWFAPAQGGTYASDIAADLIRRMANWGAAGVGQSSWGPAVYAIVDGDIAAHALMTHIQPAVGADGLAFAGPFADHGARVWH